MPRTMTAVAQVMGHAKMDTTLNIYTQVRDDSVRAAIAPVGENCSELFSRRRGRAR